MTNIIVILYLPQEYRSDSKAVRGDLGKLFRFTVSVEVFL